jgi:hypothetical protein
MDNIAMISATIPRMIAPASRIRWTDGTLTTSLLGAGGRLPCIRDNSSLPASGASECPVSSDADRVMDKDVAESLTSGESDPDSGSSDT